MKYKITCAAVLCWMIVSVTSSYGLDRAKFAALGLQELSGEKEAPDFTLLSLDGKKVSLKDYRGKVVFLNFWATWCTPCKEEFPAMERMYEDYKDKGLIILAISIDQGGKEGVKAFAEKMNATFPILLSTEGNIKNAYWTWGIPTSFLIDRNGNFLGRALGPRKWDGLEAKGLLDAVLKE
jgi:peroxiredoxin